jgi:hypothetical protein
MTEKRRGRNFLNWVLLLVAIYFMIVNPVWCMLLSHRQTEATVGLGYIARDQQARRLSSEAYGQNFSETLTSFDPDGQYVYYLSPTEHDGRDLASLGLSDPPDFAGLAPEPGIDGESFTAVAIGNIDADPELDVWYVTQSRRIENSHCDYWSFWTWAAATASSAWRRIHGLSDDAG